MPVNSIHREWALIGARIRLAELEQERQRIFAAFPQLRREAGATGRKANVPRRRGGMSDEARRAASERMKARWAKVPKSRRTLSKDARRKQRAGLKRYWAERKAAERGAKQASA